MLRYSALPVDSGLGGVCEIRNSDRDVVEHGSLAIDEAGDVLDERVRELKMRSVIGVREEDQLGVGQVLLQKRR
jgi:hypothetical protein